MIIKKPYAFLIKHFKIIHILMILPMLYLSFCFKDIADFFRTFVKADMVTSVLNTSGTYINIYMYIAIFVLLAANIAIFSLMRSKKKSSLLYFISSIYYTGLLFMTLMDYNAFISIDRKEVDDVLITIINGLSTFMLIPGYVLMVSCLSQAAGFNIKTLKFDRALDLQITDEDEEEVEINIIKSDNNIKRNFNHTLRELKYYFLENKAIITLIAIIIGISVAIAIYLEVEVYNKRYEINQAFALDKFTITLKESYLTNVDYRGESIYKGRYFLAIKLAIDYEVPEGQEKYYEPSKVDSNNFRLYYDDYIIYPSYDRSDRFLDIGKPYHGENIYPNQGAEYVLVYELDEDMVRNKYQMKILSGLKADSGSLIPSYKIINIKPQNIVEKKVTELKSSKLYDTLDLSDTLLGNMRLTIKNISYDSKYIYEYESCGSTIGCTTRKNSITPSSGKTLIVVKDSEEWDATSSYYLNGEQNFFGDFVTLQYDYTKGSGKKNTYTAKLVNVTPTTLTNAKIFEVNSLVTKGENIKLIITIRNQQYIIPIESFLQSQ